ITVGTQAVQSSEWSESSSGFRGILKDVVKTVAVVASSVGIDSEIKIGESRATRTDTLRQRTTTLAANDLDIDAQNNVALIGANVAVTDTATINANNVTIDAAQEQTVVTESHTEKTFSAEGPTLEEDQISLTSLIETEQTEKTTTTENTWAGSNITAGNLTINADQNVAILASDISVQNDADIQGENILVGGREDTTNTTHDSITETKTVTVGVKNAYVDVALAIRALDKAKDAVSDAKKAYNEAKTKVAEGRLPASDLDFYKVNLTAATANVANATLAITSAGATAAASTGTYGFYATAGATTQTDTTSTTSTQTNWNGSNISVGGNTSLTASNNLTVEGSTVDTAGQLALDAENIDIIAGKNTYSESTESHSEGTSANISLNFADGFSGVASVAGSGGVNASKSSSESQSTQQVNSGLSAGSIVSMSESLTIEGGNLNAGEIDITTDNLVVTSLQDTSTSSSKSSGGNVGFGGSGVSSVGINASKSEGERNWVDQQSGITGGTVNITAKDTSLTGAVIAAVDENGNSTDQLTLTTDTLTVADLQDTDTSKSMGIDLSLSADSTTVGANFNGHEKEQLTKATVGLGNVTVGGVSIDEQSEFADLNRKAADSQEITKDIERGGLNATATVDNRVFTEEGRNSIKKDVLDTREHAKEIAQAVEDVATTDQSVLEVFGNVQDYAKERIVLTQKAMDEAAQEKLKGEKGAEGSQEGMQALSDALSEEQGLASNANVEIYDGTQVDDNTLAIDKTAVNKTEVEGAYHEASGSILVNMDKTDMTDSSKVAATVVHEQTRHRLAQEGETGTLSRDDQTTIATNHGDRAGEVWSAYSGLAGISTKSTTSQTTWNATNKTSSVVQAGTAHIASIENTELKARQFNRNEASILDKARAAIKASPLTQEAQAQKIEQLEQLACAEVKCGAGISENDVEYATQFKGMQEAGETLKDNGQSLTSLLDELGVASTSTKEVGRVPRDVETEEFQYGLADTVNDFAARNEEKVDKVEQVSKVAAGAVGVAASTGLCSTGIGCLGGAVLGAASASAAVDGVNALSSEYTYQNGQRVADSFSTETHGGNHNPVLDATLGIAPNLLVAGGSLKAAQNSASNVLSMFDEAKVIGKQVASVSQTAVSPTMLNVVNGGVAGGMGGAASAEEGNKTQGALIGFSVGALTGLAPGPNGGIKTFAVGAFANGVGQGASLTAEEFQKNEATGFDFEYLKIIDPVQATTSGLAALGANKFVTKPIMNKVKDVPVTTPGVFSSRVLPKPLVAVTVAAGVEGGIIGAVDGNYNSVKKKVTEKINKVIEEIEK
ncbi:hemagglutinin repeat-containing protein, partial [Marinomonas transparens]